MEQRKNRFGYGSMKDHLDLGHYKSLYEHLHSYPELSNQEAKTAKKIESVLKTFEHLHVHTGIGGYGLAAVLKNGPGKTILLRADMDGLPIKEQTDLPYASRVKMLDPADNIEKPVMHACGHDLHMTCVLAATDILPAEERGTGAQAMIDDSLYERIPKPDILLGQHVIANIPAGHIGLRQGVMMASADSMRYTMIGRASHASQPDRSIDAGLMAANAITSLQQIVSREARPGEVVVVSATQLTAGVAENVIPGEIEIGVDVRTINQKTRSQVLRAVRRIIEGQSRVSGAEQLPPSRTTRCFPLTINEPQTTAALQESFKEFFGEKYDADLRPSTIAEDFPNLALDRPYVFWHLGCGNVDQFDLNGFDGDKPPVPMNHTAAFSPVVETSLEAGTDALVVAALKFFTSNWEHRPLVMKSAL